MRDPKNCHECGNKFNPRSNGQKYCDSCREPLKTKQRTNYISRKYYWKNIEKTRKRIRENARKVRRRLRKWVIAELGGKCVKCGNTDWRVLQIDHIRGGGVKELKQWQYSKGRKEYYKYVIKNIQKFQLLCANCNWIKRYENNETSLGKNIK